MNKSGCLIEIETIVRRKIKEIQHLLPKNWKVFHTIVLLKNIPISDHLLNKETDEILSGFFENIDNEEWLTNTIKSFASAFAKEHPEYSISNLSVVNGSSRTALGLLGFHCGITRSSCTVISAGLTSIVSQNQPLFR